MGLEVGEPKRVVKEKGNTTNWTNRRPYTWNGQRLMVLEVIKGSYRTPPAAFKLEWFTDKSDRDLVDASADLYLRLRTKFGMPDDDIARMFAAKVKNDALKLAKALDKKGLLGANFPDLEKDKQSIEPLRVTARVSPGNRERHLYFYPDDPDAGLGALGPELLDRLPFDRLTGVKIAWPYGTVAFRSGFEGQRRPISVESRYRCIGDLLEFVRDTSDVPVDIHLRRQINERLRKPLVELSPPPKA